MKDNRKVLKNQKVELEGTFITFDGKFNPATNTLKVYKLQGDVTLFEQAIQDYAIVNRIDKVIIVP